MGRDAVTFCHLVSRLSPEISYRSVSFIIPVSPHPRALTAFLWQRIPDSGAAAPRRASLPWAGWWLEEKGSERKEPTCLPSTLIQAILMARAKSSVPTFVTAPRTLLHSLSLLTLSPPLALWLFISPYLSGSLASDSVFAREGVGEELTREHQRLTRSRSVS